MSTSPPVATAEVCPMEEDFLKDEPMRARRRRWSSKYVNPRNAADAAIACEAVRDWLEHMESMALGFEADHCVAEALVSLATVRVYLRLAKRDGQ
jgi:hypothetical protein